MLEAKWYYSGYTPTLNEYIENGWKTVTAPLVLVHIYSFITNPIAEETMQCLVEYPNILRQSGLICRLVDDLGTSSVSNISYPFLSTPKKKKKSRGEIGVLLVINPKVAFGYVSLTYKNYSQFV